MELPPEKSKRSRRRLFVVVAIAAIVAIGAFAALQVIDRPSPVNSGGPTPYSDPMYLFASTSCVGGPCFGGNLTTAYVFDCAVAAATPAGCSTTVVIPSHQAYDYNLTIWYPRINASLPESNCQYVNPPSIVVPLPAWCTAVSANGFVVSEPRLGFA